MFWITLSSLAWIWRGDLANLVQEDGAAVGRLKKARLALGVRPCEGAPHIAEHLAFKQGGGDGGAVHRDEGAAAGLGLTDGLGEEGLSGAVLAGDQDAAVQLGQLVDPVPDGGRQGVEAEALRKGRLLGRVLAGGLPVGPLGHLDGIVALQDGHMDILNVPELDDHSVRASALRPGHGEKGGHQLKAVDLVLPVLKPRRLSVEHPGEIPLKLRPLKEVAEVIALHLEGQPGPFFAVGAAPEQVADALPAGGVALLLPELHPASRPVQNHHLSNAAEIPDGVDGVPYRNGDAAALDGEADRDPLTDGLQTEAVRVLVWQELVDGPPAGHVEDACRHQPVVDAEPGLPDADTGEILRPQRPVVRADGCVGDQHQVARLQPPGGVGVLAVVVEAEPHLGLLVDMGDDAIPIQGENGMG